MARAWHQVNESVCMCVCSGERSKWDVQILEPREGGIQLI